VAAGSAPAAEAAGGRVETVAIVAAVVAGLLIRLSAAHLKIPWFDEFLAGNLVRHSWTTLLPAIRQEAHPPLYYALLKIWCGWFGDGALGMRSLSVVAGTGAIAVAAVAVREVRGGAAAVATAVMMAFSTVQIDQGSEAKPYAVLAFFVALVLAAVVRDRRLRTPGSSLALVAAGMACASTHYYGGVAAAAIAAAALAAADGRKERIRAALLLAAVVAISLVWVAGAVRLDRRAADYIREIWRHVPLWAPFAASTRVALPGWRKPYPPMTGTPLPHVEPRELVAAAVVLAIAAGALWARRGERTRRATDSGFLALAAIGLWPGFLAVEVAFAAVDRPIALVGRSEVVAEIGMAILVSLAVARWKRPWIPILALAAAGLWTAVPPWRSRPGPTALRWEDAIVRRLRAAVPPGQHVDIVTLGLGRPPFDYYADGDPRLRLISFPESQESHPGWAAHSIDPAEGSRLAAEAERLVHSLDAELDRGVPVFVVERSDPRNAYLLALLRRDHDLRPVRWGPGWLWTVVRAPTLAA